MVGEDGDLYSGDGSNIEGERTRLALGGRALLYPRCSWKRALVRGDLSPAPLSPLKPGISLSLVSLTVKNIISGQN